MLSVLAKSSVTVTARDFDSDNQVIFKKTSLCPILVQTLISYGWRTVDFLQIFQQESLQKKITYTDR